MTTNERLHPTGGPANGLVCEALVIKSGEPFSSGENGMHRTFFQESSCLNNPNRAALITAFARA